MVKDKLLYIFMLVLLLTGVYSAASGQQPYISHFTSRDGLPGNNCYYLLQDKKGFIWIATDAGVSRYDGKVFENFSVDDGLPDNQILRLKEDSRGRIWFLALNGRMSYFFNGRFFNAGNDELLRKLNFNAAIVSLLEDSKGRLWLGTNKNLLGMWDGQTLKKFVSPNSSTQFINAYVDEDKTGAIRVYSTQAVHLFNGKNFIVEETSDLPLSYKTFNPMPDGRILFLKKDGLYQKMGALTLIKQQLDKRLLENDAGYFYSDEKEIWLSTGKGVFVIKPNSETNRFLPDMPVRQVYKDRDGNFWFTTENGVYMLPQESERVYIINKSEGLTSNLVKSIAKDRLGNFWLGLDGGRIDMLSQKGKKQRTILLQDRVRYNKVKQLTISGNDMYFASDNGLGVIENIQAHAPAIKYLQEKNNSVFVIKNFSLGKKDTLAMALSSGVVILPADKNKFSFNTSDYKDNINFFKDRSYRVFYDQRNTLWFSNINGLSSLTGGVHARYYLSNKVLEKRINDICSLSNKTLAMATDGYGIVILENNRVSRIITRADGLTSNICYRLFYKNGFLWAITNQGLNRINLNAGTGEIKTYQLASELLKGEVNDLFIDDNQAYFATNSGLIYFPNTSMGSREAAPKTYVTAINIDRRPVDLSEVNPVLKSGYSNITFNFSAIDFKNRMIIYRYRLKSDAAWTETRNRRLEFSSLEPGKYTFEVAARSLDGTWGNTASHPFELKSKFWQTAWFWILISIAGAFILYKIAVIITRSQKNKEKLQLTMRNKILTLEQQALQALMNPHFIFNVMNSIQHFINTQNKTSANKMLTGFARLIRKNLEICTKSFITIEKELEYLNLYLTLEKSRFGEQFNFTIHTDKNIDTEETLIPSMLLQPFVENAIWHGLTPLEGAGVVQIQLSLDNNILEILITDNGIGYETSLQQKKEGHISKGMALTKERIRLINNIEQNSIQLSVRELPKGGTEVKITVPVDNNYR